MPNKCCVVNCNKAKGFQFPNNVERRKRWMVAVKRDKWSPSPHSVVCEDHFLPTDFLDGPTSMGALIRYKRRLKPDAVPSQFFWSLPASEQDDKRKQRASKRQQKRERKTGIPSTLHQETEVMECMQQELDDFQGVSLELETDTADSQTLEVPSPDVDPTADRQSTTTQTDRAETRVAEVQTEYGSTPPPFLSIEALQLDPPLLHYYTGLETHQKFTAVFNTLGPAVNHLRYLRSATVTNISPINQFILMLAKLRQGLNYLPLSRMCNVSVFTVENVFLTWINFCSRQWGEINTWVSPELVRFFAPSDFKSKFPSTRVILDGTEIPVEKPSNPAAQRASFSTYKNTNTVKAVVGATPGGLISYISATYGGSTSDRQIMERSSLPGLCDGGDSVMADKGFNVQDMFAPYDVQVNIPAFFSKKNRLTEKQVLDDRKVSSKRVHIERLIGMGKTYKILLGPLTASETRLARHILSVCFALCNIRNNVVSKHA